MYIQANIGLAPWDAFSMGGSYMTGMSFGDFTIVSGLVILVIDVLLKEKIGIGTILNTILIGKFVDLAAYLDLIPVMSSLFSSILLLIIAQFTVCLATYFYIGAGMGCGPRDALMVALAKRAGKIPIGAVRSLIEGAVLIAGWLMGAKIGLGTVIAVLSIGLAMQLTFKLLNFDVKNIEHESVTDTWKIAGFNV